MSTPPDAKPEAVGPPGGPALAEPVLARQNRLRLSLVWIVPIVAFVIGAVLVVRALLAIGPEIGIVFRGAEGIEPGRTEVRFKDVAVGRVKRVTIQPDRQTVRVVVGLDKSAAHLAVADTRFWVVRPRIGTAGVSGLNTLLSGAYIGVDAGAADETQREFIGLDSPPLVLRGEPGRSFVMRADDLGSLDVGSPVYHRRIRVGRVVGYSLDATGKAVEVQVFIESPNENLVTLRSRFWNASGLDVQLNASGLTVNAQSVASVIAGGLAFSNPAEMPRLPPAPPGTAFKLYPSERVAVAPDDGEPLRVRMVFDQSLRGLDDGAPMDLLGVEIGSVRSIALQPEASVDRLPVEVTAELFPRRIGRLRERFIQSGAAPELADRLLLKQLVDRGLRAQLRNGNLLTGRLYVALEFMPKAGRATFDASASVPTLPTVPGTLADVQPQLAEIVGRLSKVRFDEIGTDLQQVLRTVNESGASLKSAIASADTLIRTLTPEAQQTLAETRKTLAEVQKTLGSADKTLKSADANLADPDSTLQRNAVQTLADLQRAAQALRVLADYLQQHPESLLRGKPADPDTTRPREGSR